MKRIGVKVPNIDSLKFLKRDILYFDKIIIAEDMLELSKNSLESMASFLKKDVNESISYYYSILEYLVDQNIVELINHEKYIKSAIEKITEEQRKELLEDNKLIEEHKKY